jgi:hypothetical protein
VRKKAQIIEPRGLQMRNVKSVCFTVVCALGLLGTAASSAHAVTFTGTNGSNLSASAAFTVVGGNLNVVLTNTSTSDVLNQSQLLSAVFFDITAVGALTPHSATLTGGSTVLFDSQPANGIVGGEWAYRSNSSLPGPGGATEGISSSGFGLFGQANFPGPDLDPPTAVNGFNYGITSAGDDPTTGNGAVTGQPIGNPPTPVPFIQNAVAFVLYCNGAAGSCAESILDTITRVSFQYGTALTDTNIPGVPLPPALVLFGTALVGMGVLSRRRRTKHAAA